MVTIADSHTIVEPYMPEPIDKAATGELDDVIANGLGNPSPDHHDLIIRRGIQLGPVRDVDTRPLMSDCRRHTT